MPSPRQRYLRLGEELENPDGRECSPKHRCLHLGGLESE